MRRGLVLKPWGLSVQYSGYERLSMINYTFQLVEFLVQISLSASTQVFQECWSGVPPPSKMII